MKYLAVAAFWLTVLLTPLQASAAITGNIDGVTKGAGTYLLKGWACDTGIASSVSVHVYAGGVPGVGTLVTAATANLASEPAVNTACGTPTGTAHRFSIPLSNSVVSAHGGKSLYVYGISLSGGSNNALGNSGVHQVPTQPLGVIGNIVGISGPTASGYTLTGWACDQTYSQSIAVHVYVGGSAGSPGAQFLTSGTANGASPSSDNTACATVGGTPHRFSIPITHAMVNAHYLKPIHVHGISVSGAPNATIARSGVETMPDVGSVIGIVDGVTDRGTVIDVGGWACQYGVDQSIDVHLYAGGPAGTGTLVATKTANVSKTAGVSAACATTNSAHRFVFSLSREQVLPHVGKQLHLYGIHTVGDVPNAMLSGNPSLPTSVAYQLSEKLPATDLTIQPGEKVTINTSADLGLLTINGQMYCPTTGSFELKAQGILVSGSNALFECGNASTRFGGSLVIKLKGGRVSMGERAFAAMNGGTLRLFGDGKKKGWQRINATIPQGSSTLVLSTAASDWAIGDRIVVGPTSYNYAEAEERTISAISADKKTITVNQPFSYSHHGLTQSYSSGVRSWTLDERAEVANLTRNIRIEPDGTEANLDAAAFGGHMMIMKTARGYVDGVELVRMGQQGQMGRYPFHWHLAGSVQGQFIRNSSIRNSYQRCVTVHGTNDALVENNVCYNHFGHGFFLEDGNEVNNQLLGNLTILSKRIPQSKALLASDYVSPGIALERFSPPGAFWISNPQNTVSGNVASGSQGSGFWMAFSQVLACTSSGCFFPDASMPAPAGSTLLYPAQQSTQLFSDNVAHSSDVGMTWDGAPDAALTNNPLNSKDRFITASHYHTRGTTNPNGAIPVMNNLVVFKNKLTGVYTRGATMTFNNFIAADNGNSLFFAYNQVVSDSLVVGFSANHSTADLDFHQYNGGWVGRLFQGVRLYDGPFDLRNIHFAGFPSQRIFHNGWDVTPVPFYAIGGAQRFVNTVRGLTFNPEPYQRVALDPAAGNVTPPWQDSLLNSAVKDLDGSLSGVAGAIVVPNHPMNDDPSCTPMSNINLTNTVALRCQYDLGLVGFFATQYAPGSPYTPHLGNLVPTRFERSDGASDEYDIHDSNIYWNKAMFILDKGYSYKVTFTQEQPTVPRIWFQASSQSTLSPVIELVGLKNTCVPQGGTQVGSLSQLASLTTMSGATSYYKDASGSLFVRMRGNQIHRDFWSENAMSATTYHVMLSCP